MAILTLTGGLVPPPSPLFYLHFGRVQFVGRPKVPFTGNIYAFKGMQEPQVLESFSLMIRQSWDHQPHKRSFSAIAGIHEETGLDAGGFVFQRQTWNLQPNKGRFPSFTPHNINAIGNLRLRMRRGK